MAWKVEMHEDFAKEFHSFRSYVQDEVLARALVLQQIGPTLGRPHADTLKGSKHANMKELRFDVRSEIWRVAFAFDPKRKAIILAAGDKKGKNETRFYKRLIKIADNRFDQHLLDTQ